jgi:hypothetical protein
VRSQQALEEDYLEQCRLRANRYMGQWTGTAGSLAADVRRLLAEVQRLKVLLAHASERPDLERIRGD